MRMLEPWSNILYYWILIFLGFISSLHLRLWYASLFATVYLRPNNVNKFWVFGLLQSLEVKPQQVPLCKDKGSMTHQNYLCWRNVFKYYKLYQVSYLTLQNHFHSSLEDAINLKKTFMQDDLVECYPLKWAPTVSSKRANDLSWFKISAHASLVSNKI